MKLAMAQFAVSNDTGTNLQKTIAMIERADADLIFFPEIQLTPFFPQYRKNDLKVQTGLDPEQLVMELDSPEVTAIREACRTNGTAASPNLYIRECGNAYDMSLMIDSKGTLMGTSSMVHIFQGANFYEKDYYTPSHDGFKVYQFPFGRVGIVICFDRHLPESIRSCAAMGAQLIIIPTANTISEPMELFEWELRTQAWQNNVFIAMCNRVGTEGNMTFSGESLIVSPDGDTLLKAHGDECLIVQELDLSRSDISRKRRPYLDLRRPEMYQ